MTKKIMIGLSVLLVLVFAVPAFGAITGLTDSQKQDLNDMQKKIVELRKQMVDKYAESGQLTADQAKTIKENIDKAEQNREKSGILPGAGLGRGGNGFGGCGLGRGAGNGCGGGGCGFGAGTGTGTGTGTTGYVTPQGTLQ